MEPVGLHPNAAAGKHAGPPIEGRVRNTCSAREVLPSTEWKGARGMATACRPQVDNCVLNKPRPMYRPMPEVSEPDYACQPHIVARRPPPVQRPASTSGARRIRHDVGAVACPRPGPEVNLSGDGRRLHRAVPLGQSARTETSGATFGIRRRYRASPRGIRSPAGWDR
jgi:hypothetical protein